MKYSIQTLNLSTKGFQRFADSPRDEEICPQASHENDSAEIFALCAQSGKNVDT